MSISAKAQTGGKSHLPFWKAGSGHYGNTLGQIHRQIVTRSMDLILSFIDSIPIDKSGVFTIGDYGTNDGYASMPLVRSLIEHLRKKHGEDLTIQIIYEDQEKNDFNSLFSRLSGSSSYLHKFKDVYTLATNINFYKQCVPDGTCDVIFTSIATHWLENLEVNFKDCVFHVFATKEEQRRVHVEAERDWTKFLALRAKELAPGGLLIALNASSNDERSIVSDILQCLEKAWKQLKEDKMITQEEFEKCTAKLCVRNAEEIKSPFEKEDSAVRQSGLRLLYYDEVLNSFGYDDFWKQHVDKAATLDEDRTVYTDYVVAYNRVWSQTTFYSSLSERRTGFERDNILNALFQRFHALVMSTPPEDFKYELNLSRMIARKVE